MRGRLGFSLRVEPLRSPNQVSFGFENIRQQHTALSYYTTELVTTVKSFKVDAAGLPSKQISLKFAGAKNVSIFFFGENRELTKVFEYPKN